MRRVLSLLALMTEGVTSKKTPEINSISGWLNLMTQGLIHRKMPKMRCVSSCLTLMTLGVISSQEPEREGGLNPLPLFISGMKLRVFQVMPL
jgi:hypothetical protein